MCSNFQPIKTSHQEWVKRHFDTDLPIGEWRDDAYPAYPAPFIYLDEGKPKCRLAKFGLVPYWAADIKNFALTKYNARSETVAELKTYKSAWKERRFGLILMESFYEPRYESNDPKAKSVRWRIKRADNQPEAAACIWERYIDKSTGEIVMTFSMLTINATDHPVMKHFHKPDDEKRSIVIIDNSNFDNWMNADHLEARELLNLTPPGFLNSEPAPKIKTV